MRVDLHHHHHHLLSFFFFFLGSTSGSIYNVHTFVFHLVWLLILGIRRLHKLQFPGLGLVRNCDSLFSGDGILFQRSNQSRESWYLALFYIAHSARALSVCACVYLSTVSIYLVCLSVGPIERVKDGLEVEEIHFIGILL